MRKQQDKWTGSRMTRFSLIFLAGLVLFGGSAASGGQEPSAAPPPGYVPAHTQTPAADPAPLIDAPMPMLAEAHPGAAAPAQDATPNPSPESSSSAQQQPNQNKPLGTAAAPPESTMGVTASRPAGAVIAPAKQRRQRAIFVRVALVVGAGVALGTVMALTHATPSQPR
jgi:hypothetical protein